MQAFELSILAAYVVELVSKLIVHRLYFFCNNEWSINMLDFCLVVYSLADAVLISTGMNLTFLRTLRVFKFAKVLRLLRAVSIIKDLRVMMECVIGSMMALIWSIVLISFFLYVFSLFFVQAMAKHVSDSE